MLQSSPEYPSEHLHDPSSLQHLLSQAVSSDFVDPRLLHMQAKGGNYIFCFHPKFFTSVPVHAFSSKIVSDTKYPISHVLQSMVEYPGIHVHDPSSSQHLLSHALSSAFVDPRLLHIQAKGGNMFTGFSFQFYMFLQYLCMYFHH